MINKKENDYGTGIPRHEAEILARTLWPSLKAYLESEEGQREFADWKLKNKNRTK